MTATVDLLPNYLPKHDRECAARFISECMRRNYAISVYDGMEWTVEGSRDPAVIAPAMGSTDMDRIRVVDELNERVGTFIFIWGNSEGETIADSTTGAAADELYEYANKPWN